MSIGIFGDWMNLIKASFCRVTNLSSPSTCKDKSGRLRHDRADERGRFAGLGIRAGEIPPICPLPARHRTDHF